MPYVRRFFVFAFGSKKHLLGENGTREIGMFLPGMALRELHFTLVDFVKVLFLYICGKVLLRPMVFSVFLGPSLALNATVRVLNGLQNTFSLVRRCGI